MPAPIAPWMSASEALTIWMLSTAMKAPSVAPATAIHVLADTAGSAGTAARLLSKSAEEAALRAGCSVVMAVCSRSGGGGVHRSVAVDRGRGVCGDAACRVARSDRGRLGVDGWLGRHARAQQALQAVVVEHDLHRHALHDLGEVAGGVVGRQQREFEAARRRQAVD